MVPQANNVQQRKNRSSSMRSKTQRNSRTADQFIALEEEDDALGSACSLKALNSNEGVVNIGGSHGSNASSPAVIQVRKFSKDLALTMSWRLVCIE